MRLLVTGTSGGIGGAVKTSAARRGFELIELNRADFELPELPIVGTVDAVVFATGMCPIRPVALTPDELFAETLRVNCGLFLRLMRELVARRLYAPAGTRVVAISSVSATEGWTGGACYCASKGALSAMCRALDAELRLKRISVRVLEPRYVKTRMFDACAGRMGVPASVALDPAVFAETILEAVL